MLYIITAKVKKKDINARKTVNDKVTHLVNAVDEADAILTINNHYGGKSSSDLSHNVKILEVVTAYTNADDNSGSVKLNHKKTGAGESTELRLHTKTEGVDLFGFIEGLQFTYYKAPDNFYTKHIDTWYKGPVRKLSMSLLLFHLLN